MNNDCNKYMIVSVFTTASLKRVDWMESIQIWINILQTLRQQDIVRHTITRNYEFTATSICNKLCHVTPKSRNGISSPNAKGGITYPPTRSSKQGNSPPPPTNCYNSLTVCIYVLNMKFRKKNRIEILTDH